MSSAGEVITLAEATVDLAKPGLIAQALVTATLASATADLLALSFPADIEVHAASLTLLALALGAQVARLTVASPTIISTCK